MKLLPTSLFARLILLVALGALISVLSLGSYLAYEQSRIAILTALNESEIIAQGLANSVTPQLIIKDYGAVEQAAKQFTAHTHINRLKVINHRNIQVVATQFNPSTQSWNIIHGGLERTPKDIQIHSEVQNEILVTWAPIKAGDHLGWVYLETSLQPIVKIQHKIYLDTLLIACLSVVFSTVIIGIALSRPIQDLRKATDFARSLPEKHGKQLPPQTSSSEIFQLINSLNEASKELCSQDQELQRLSTLIEFSDDPFYIIDVTDDIFLAFVNNAACRHFDISREALMARPVHEWFPEQAILNLKASLVLNQSSHTHIITHHVNSAGESIPVELYANYILHAQRALVAGYFKNISERVKAEQALKHSRDQAQAMAKVKSEFLANMSHEIRTPMNGIIGLSQLALNHHTSPEVREYLQNIFISSKNLLDILNAILDFSKLDAGRMQLDFYCFELRELVRNLRNLFYQAAASKGLKLIFAVDDNIPRFLMGDGTRIQQILANLLGNAIKFTEKGFVRVNINMSQFIHPEVCTELYFEVVDSGIGIHPLHLDSLFQPFIQADGSINRKFGGTGLGLTICDKILKLMDSHFQVDSQIDVGSSFKFSLKLQMPAAGIEPEQNTPKVIAEGALAESLQRKAALLQGKQILLVEDNRINQMVIAKFLKLSGLGVEIASNGMEALQILERSAFDLILMDIQMPILDGIETSKRIRQLPQFANLPIIALSAGVTEEEQLNYKNSGMNDFVPKPVVPEVLIDCLNKWLIV